jgi:hypothetical protein
MSAGLPTFFRVVPSNAGQDAELLLMESVNGNAATFVRGRPSAVRVASATGPGGAEAFNYAAPAPQWDGLVLLNKSGSGNYTVYRDTTAPSGSVVINGGAATTASPNVSLALSATDAQTGINQMRISTDGALDSEPFVPFAAAANVSLPGGAGVKTVLVQYTNNAGMTSATFSDTIQLVTGLPDLIETAVSNPPATGHRDDTFNVTDTAKNVGAVATGHTAKTRYFLSKDAIRSAGDKGMNADGGPRVVPNLAVNGTSSGTKTVHIGNTMKAGKYFVLACADEGAEVAESNEANQCVASATKIQIIVP